MNNYLVLLFAMLVIVSPHSLAAERLSLQVVCELAEHRFRINLTDAQAEQIEGDCAGQVAGLLRDRFRFVDFVAGETRANRLLIRIGKSAAEADASAIRAVNFEIEVEGSNVIEGGEPVRWEFRSIAEFLDVPAADNFADAVAVRFGQNLETREAQLVQGQLSRMRLAGSAYPLPNDQSWLLPFSRDELGIADNSEFKIKAALVFPSSEERFTYQVILFGDFATAAGVPPEFHNKVKALHLRDDKLPQAASIQRLLNAQDVRVDYVKINHYVPISKPDRTSPGGLLFGQEGDQ